MAEVTRLELATSCVTGKHSNQLSYTSINGGHNWARTSDPLLVRQVLSQLSYATRKKCVKTQMVGLAGFEPTHRGVKVHCLTAWLQPIKTISIISYFFYFVKLFLKNLLLFSKRPFRVFYYTQYTLANYFFFEASNLAQIPSLTKIDLTVSVGCAPFDKYLNTSSSFIFT